MKYWIKEVNGFTDTQKPIEYIIKENGEQVISPDYEPYPEYTDEEAAYENYVNSLIREKYSLSQELAILRQRNTKPEEYNAYNAYCEACKAEAKARYNK